MFPDTRNVCQIRFYSKPGCHLCVKVEDLLETAQYRWPLQIQVVNILRDSNLYALYHERIPVLEFPDGSLVEPPIRAETLNTMIRRFCDPQ